MDVLPVQQAVSDARITHWMPKKIFRPCHPHTRQKKVKSRIGENQKSLIGFSESQGQDMRLSQVFE